MSLQTVCEWTQQAFLLQKSPVNELEISEAFAREWAKVTMGNLGVTSTVSFIVEHHVRKQRFKTPVYPRVDCPAKGF